MDLENLLLTSIEKISSTDFSIVILFVEVFFFAFWVIVLGWVWVDSGERTTNVFVRVVSVLVVALLNVLGLIIYLIVRPKHTIQELYWADLERRYLKYETNELGDCPQCGLGLQPGFNVCPRCGLKLKVMCSGCNVWVDKAYSFCPYCATGISREVQVEQSVSPEQMQGEVNKSKTEAIKAVEGNKTKYVDRHGILTRFKQEFKAVFAKKMDENKAEIVEEIQISQEKSNKKNKKKKKKRAKR